MYAILKNTWNYYPLLGFVVTIGTFMFIYKLETNSNLQIDKQKRQEILRERSGFLQFKTNFFKKSSVLRIFWSVQQFFELCQKI